MKQSDIERCSHKLAYLLRHDKTIERQSGGWVEISVVMNQTGYKADMIKEVVTLDKKGRFEIDEANNLIRALYGHSVSVNMGYPEVPPPSKLLHGSAANAIQQIMRDGLNPRSRQFVHLTDDFDMAFNTGERHGDSTVLNIDAYKMYQDGFKFYNPVPHVWLVSSVPPQYIEPIGALFKEENNNMLTQKSLCIINLSPHGVSMPNLCNIADYSDFYHISQYDMKEWYNLIIIFVNEYDDWKSWKTEVEKIKSRTANFILFYTYEVHENLDIDVPYFKTTLYPNEILRIMDSVLYGGDPMPIDYYDFTALILKNENLGELSSFKVYDAYGGNQLLDYIKRLGDSRKTLLIHFTIPTRVSDMHKLVADIQESIAAIPQEISFVWGCSFANDWDVHVSIFEK